MSENVWNIAHAWKTLAPFYLSRMQFLHLSMPQRLHLQGRKLYGAYYVHLMCLNACNPHLNAVR